MDALYPGLQQASVNTSENNTKVRTPSCVNSEQEVLGLVVVQVMAELSGFWVSFQSQTKTSEKVYGIQSV